MSATLFAPTSLRKLALPNRIVVSPMAQYSACNDGLATPWHFVHVGNLLISGPGLVIMEATAVEPKGRVSPACLGLWSDKQIDNLKKIVLFSRRYKGGALGIQLAHSGRKGSVSVPWEGQRPLPTEEDGWKTVSPTSTPYPGRPTPHAL